ncbi:MAG: hypothetical protein QM733_09460 [Ilumatobacteraceae bacterium]
MTEPRLMWHTCIAVEPSSRRAVEPSSRRAVEPSSRRAVEPSTELAANHRG